jgi:hypothetical protein
MASHPRHPPQDARPRCPPACVLPSHSSEFPLTPRWRTCWHSTAPAAPMGSIRFGCEASQGSERLGMARHLLLGVSRCQSYCSTTKRLPAPPRRSRSVLSASRRPTAVAILHGQKFVPLVRRSRLQAALKRPINRATTNAMHNFKEDKLSGIQYRIHSSPASHRSISQRTYS